MPEDVTRCRRDVLLVEDNAKDIRLVREVIAERRLDCELHLARDGASALRLLLDGTLRPDLILLDIHLPVLSGIEVLQRIRGYEALRLLPVLVLTTSKAEQDIRRCYELNANAYLVKPADYEEFSRMIAAIDEFWLRNAVLPRTALCEVLR